MRSFTLCSTGTYTGFDFTTSRCVLGHRPICKPQPCVKYGMQLPRGGSHNRLPFTTPHLSLLQVGCDSHSFAAAELVFIGSCTSAVELHAAKPRLACDGASSATVVGFQHRTWRPNSLHGVSVMPVCRAVCVVLVCAVEYKGCWNGRKSVPERSSHSGWYLSLIHI